MNLTNNEIRKQNLLILIKEVGKKSDLAKLADTDPAYISQVLSEKTKRNIGDDFARKLEKGCKKPRGWMDVYHSIEENKLPKDINLSALMSSASPRTHTTLEAIEKAWQEGKLTEEDLKLLDTIARRLAHDKSSQDR